MRKTLATAGWLLLLGAAAAGAQETRPAPAGDAARVTPPVWAKPDHFWFRKALPNGFVWLQVDALHGVKEPLFDHQRLAVELGVRTGAEFSPLTLPFVDPAAQFVVKYDGSNAYIQQGAMAIEFIMGGSVWRCDLQIKWNWNLVPPTDYECLPRRPAVPGQSLSGVTAQSQQAPVKSPDGRWEAFIQNHNVALRSAEGGPVTMLSTDGIPDDAWLPGSIRWSADGRSLTAYRVNAAVWQSESVSGNVQRHIAQRTFELASS